MIEVKLTFTARKTGNVLPQYYQSYQDLMHAPDCMKDATDEGWTALVVTTLGSEYKDIDNVVAEVQE